MARSRSSTAVIHDELGLGLVVYSQYAFDFCAVSYAPNCVMSQLRMVAAVAGRTRRKDLLNELTAKFESAGSILPALASLTGFSELTNPERDYDPPREGNREMAKHDEHSGDASKTLLQISHPDSPE
ncbi:MAG: hypothetical protein L6R39_004565 [Caloplaca ligustica]|nr:MAG: hypothetical protein L6R39_004565 [Caloplaca ligustica]